MSAQEHTTARRWARRCFVHLFCTLFLITPLGVTQAAHAQGTLASSPKPDKKHRRRGGIFLSWGYNRASYTASDIHFTGPGYDFTLGEITAHDSPIPFSFGAYFSNDLTIPQYDARVGYYAWERTSISLGMTHMKYVATWDQGTNITGTIDSTASAEFAGEYDNDPIAMTQDFLRFEHTDGLNYVSLEIETLIPLKETESHKNGAYLTLAGGGGPVVPKSNVMLFNERPNDQVRLAGFGVSSKVGLKVEFLRYFFVHGFVNTGYVHLNNIPTRSGDGPDRATQSFYFLEGAAVLGMTIFAFQ